MQTVVIVIHLMVVLAMAGLVLLQRSEGGGLGMGGGGFLTSRGTANVLTRTTAILAGVFFATSLLLSVLAGFERKPKSILDGGTAAPAGPVAPIGQPVPFQAPGALLDQTRPSQAPPAEPQVPHSQ